MLSAKEVNEMANKVVLSNKILEDPRLLVLINIIEKDIRYAMNNGEFNVRIDMSHHDYKDLNDKEIFIEITKQLSNGKYGFIHSQPDTFYISW